jgi:hypothetical protein
VCAPVLHKRVRGGVVTLAGWQHTAHILDASIQPGGYHICMSQQHNKQHMMRRVCLRWRRSNRIDSCLKGGHRYPGSEQVLVYWYYHGMRQPHAFGRALESTAGRQNIAADHDLASDFLPCYSHTGPDYVQSPMPVSPSQPTWPQW